MERITVVVVERSRAILGLGGELWQDALLHLAEVFSARLMHLVPGGRGALRPCQFATLQLSRSERVFESHRLLGFDVLNCLMQVLPTEHLRSEFVSGQEMMRLNQVLANHVYRFE